MYYPLYYYLSTVYNRPIAEPLISRPPDRPPPVLQENANFDSGVAQGEQIEMAQYSAPQVHPMPLPYEKVSTSMPRYATEPVVTEKAQHSRAIAPHTAPESLAFPEPEHASAEPEVTADPETETYYSRPKFFKQGLNYSTSTHIYGECEPRNNSGSSSMYISPQNLEPFFAQDVHEITEKELMLASIEESYTSSDFLPSDTDDGSYDDDEEGEDVTDSAESLGSGGGKSPATGQVKALGDSDENEYINARQALQEGAQNTEFNPEYMNTEGSINQVSITSAPNMATTKKKKVKRNRSTPTRRKKGDALYTGLVHETSNYTSVYSSTLRKKQGSSSN